MLGGTREGKKARMGGVGGRRDDLLVLCWSRGFGKIVSGKGRMKVQG